MQKKSVLNHKGNVIWFTIFVQIEFSVLKWFIFKNNFPENIRMRIVFEGISKSRVFKFL